MYCCHRHEYGFGGGTWEGVARFDPGFSAPPSLYAKTYTPVRNVLTLEDMLGRRLVGNEPANIVLVVLLCLNHPSSAKFDFGPSVLPNQRLYDQVTDSNGFCTTYQKLW